MDMKFIHTIFNEILVQILLCCPQNYMEYGTKSFSHYYFISQQDKLLYINFVFLIKVSIIYTVYSWEQSKTVIINCHNRHVHVASGCRSTSSLQKDFQL